MRYSAVFVLMLVGCGSDCERAQNIISAKMQRCGLDANDGTDTGPSDCTATQGDFAMCLAHCTRSAPCAALDGTDFQASIDMFQCESQCGGSSQ